jgi:hypothetical protein
MLELIVLVLFIFSGYLITVGNNLYLKWRDEKQENAVADIMIATRGKNVSELRQKLGEPYEVEPGTTGRVMYLWKFPPAVTIPPGRGLLTLIVTTDQDVIVDIRWKRKR